MSDQSRDLVPSDTARNAVESWGFGQMLGRYFFTMDRADQQYKHRLFALLNEQGVDGEGWINRPITIVAYLLQPATFIDKDTGEEVTTLMSKLLLNDGTVIVTHSGGVAKTLMQAGELLGLPSDKSPYHCTVKARQLRNGKRMWYLDFTGDAKKQSIKDR